MTLLVAGHETTATGLAWAVERLVRHPRALRRLEEEAGTDETAFAEAVSMETLRLRPVLMFVVRRLVAPLEVGGRTLPAGVNVTPCIHLVHRRPEVYPDPLAFKPERWLDATPGTYTWIPFGGGRRRCIGASFAMTEMEVVLRTLAANLRLEPVGPDERPVRRFITSSPQRGGEVRATPVAAVREGETAVLSGR
jgi:cytochrome P450